MKLFYETERWDYMKLFYETERWDYMKHKTNSMVRYNIYI
jgi:hypothetical protein